MTPTPMTDLALLQWHIELGATEAIGDMPVNRYEVQAEKPVKIVEKSNDKINSRIPESQNPKGNALRLGTTAAVKADIKAANVAATKAATVAAAQCGDLDQLKSAIAAFDFCDLKKGARNLVFADGNPMARVMVIGEAPSREEDQAGKPFVGAAGQLLDKMFAAIDLARHDETREGAIYVTNILPWRPPQSREPSPEEIEMMLPFVKRHITLVGPELIVLMGNTACQALLGRRGMTRLRGQWTTCLDLPTIPMFPPDRLLRNPISKREAWADLLSLQSKMKG